MKNLKFLVAMLVILTSLTTIKAQTEQLNVIAYEGAGGISVLFVALGGNTDVDSTTFVDWTPFRGASTINYSAQTMDSINQTVTDTVIVYILTYSGANATPTYYDTVTVIGGQSGTLGTVGSPVLPLVGLRATTTATVAKKSRKLIFKLDAAYTTGIDPEVIRKRIYGGKYGTGGD